MGTGRAISNLRVCQCVRVESLHSLHFCPCRLSLPLGFWSALSVPVSIPALWILTNSIFSLLYLLQNAILNPKLLLCASKNAILLKNCKKRPKFNPPFLYFAVKNILWLRNLTFLAFFIVCRRQMACKMQSLCQHHYSWPPFARIWLRRVRR